jgi:acetolactate synthase-1/3 small subunit/acetolactate synthase II small subunit
VSGRIEIGFNNAEGAVLRMLGAVERRGFELRGISMSERGGEAALSLEVQARLPERSLEVVAAQLRRLDEVRQVSFSTSGPGASS